jgi:hypothetical protein
VEFVPTPIRFASDIFNRVKTAPTRWGGRLSSAGNNLRFLKNTAFPGLKNIGVKSVAPGLKNIGVRGSLKGVAKAAPIASQVYGVYEGTRRLLKGEPGYKVGLGYGYALPGPWGWANFAADSADSMLSSNVDLDATKKGLEKYGFNENFALEPNTDGNYSVVRSEAGKRADAFLDAKDDWLAKTANSPAARSGAFTDDERWSTYLGNQAWRKDQGRSYNTNLDAHLRPSSENKRHWNVFGNEMVFDK